MHTEDKPVANPVLVLREEFDDWAVLFDPDTGAGFGLNPVSVLIWKCLDGGHTLEDIHGQLCAVCEEVPGNARQDIADFVDDLISRGYAGFEISKDSMP